MKLIDLLVQELPKRGGWPDGAERASVGGFNGNSITVVFCSPRGYSNGFDAPFQYAMTFSIPDCCVNVATDYCMITRDLYESVLAASKKPAWNGEGVPPVGCECECHVDEDVVHCIVVGYDFDGKAVVMRNVPARKYFSIQANSGRIKPLRTKAERKRDAAVEAIDYWMPEFIEDIPNQFYHAKKLYDAIAAGKIPGVKLND